jgi:pyrimidine operon attenuation protein/uracil phosphoribosyltransferase
VGKNIPTSLDERVDVLLKEDGHKNDMVCIRHEDIDAEK